MKCQNCGENDANVKYTQIINGVKKQFNLCDECANKLGISNMNFGMPMAFSSVLDDMLDMYNGSLSLFRSPDLLSIEIPRIKAPNENEGQNDFIKEEHKEESELNNENDFNKIWGINKNKEDNNNSCSKLEMLQKRLEQEIKEERFEDAAKTRDEIKKLK